MRTRFRAALAAAVVVSVTMSLSAMPVVGQSQPSQAQTSQAPRSKAEIDAAKEAERQLILKVAEDPRVSRDSDGRTRPRG